MKSREPGKRHADRLIVVNNQDRVVAYESKGRCHQGEGLLHRAFSIFMFDEQRRLLIQRRSSHKPLWPLFWSGSVCSHPRIGETIRDASNRRLREEVRLESRLKTLFKFRYEARFGSTGIEKEMCSVLIGRCCGKVEINPLEIEEWAFVDIAGVTSAIRKNPVIFTPWFKMEWERLVRDHLSDVESLF